MGHVNIYIARRLRNDVREHRGNCLHQELARGRQLEKRMEDNQNLAGSYGYVAKCAPRTGTNVRSKIATCGRESGTFYSNVIYKKQATTTTPQNTERFILQPEDGNISWYLQQLVPEQAMITIFGVKIPGHTFLI